MKQVSKVEKAQESIDGTTVARMIVAFHEEFRGTYPVHVMTSSLCAVGPLQAMIGLAIQRGLLPPAQNQPRKFDLDRFLQDDSNLPV
ncbi:MAG: hypothetical protein EOO12_00120 [Chitinophagaceae bacterium]|nr:MAG: hypothetical protein EOO12_00120 [Chitinophagaceae bacterium]